MSRRDNVCPRIKSVSDYYSIQEVGGAELSSHYPDRGIIADSNWYNAGLTVKTNVEGWRGWLIRLRLGYQAFGAILSANGEGIRVFIALDKFSAFLPWSKLSVSAERTLLATIIRLTPAAVPSLTLVCHLADEAANDLLRHTDVQLHPRIPPRRLAWETDNPWLFALILFSVAFVFLVTWRLLMRAM
jgi:hypothetical protein